MLRTPESYQDFAQRCRPDVEILVKLSIIFQDIVDKVNAKARSDRSSGVRSGDSAGEGSGSETTNISFTTAEGATVSGSIIATADTEADIDSAESATAANTAEGTSTSDTTSEEPLPLELSAEEVHAQLDQVDAENAVMGKEPVDRDAVM